MEYLAMSRIRQQVNVSIVSTALVLGAVVGFQARAQRAVGPAPPVIAAVRMERLFDRLHERAAAAVEMDRLETEISQEGLRRQEALRQMEEELESVAGSARRQELSDRIELERLKARFWNQQATAELEEKAARRLQELYRSIKASIEGLAGVEGYDIVIINDAIDEPSFDADTRIPAQVQILQQISARKVLYLNPAIDITDDLIVRMNNAFRASGGRR